MTKTARANISWVTPDLATGGDLSPSDPIAAEQLVDILDSGVSAIVDMRIEANDAGMWEHYGVPYLNLGTDDREGHSIQRGLFDRVVARAREVAEEDGKLLVHCHMGINRGPSAAYAVLLDRGHEDLEAYELIREARPEVGLYYAMDALKAHLHRTKANAKQTRLRRVRLQEHIDSIWTPGALADLDHTMAANHRRYDDELRSAG